MKKYILIAIAVVATLFLLKSCTKDDVETQYVAASTENTDSTQVSTRYGINQKAIVLFLGSCTTSNYRLDSLRYYVSYNAEEIDSFILDQVSASHAYIYYTNVDKFDAANYDVQIIFKNGKVETLYGVLAKYGGAHYTYKPDTDEDFFYKNPATKVIYKQKKAFKKVKLNYIDYVANIHIWEVYTDNLQTNKDYLYPQKVEDYEFLLNNKP